MDQPGRWLRVPVGDEAGRWAARGRCRRVLLIVHNVTAATRLLDVVPLFRDDLRVQLLLTWTGSSPFDGGLDDLFRSMGLPVLPWDQAVRTEVDLAISSSLGGRLDSVTGKLVLLSHGVGYNKKLAAPEQRSGAPVFGLAPEWLLDRDGVPFADAMVFSHPEQVERLRLACPQAVPTAVLGGDPCFDRILAARHHRERYRRSLGVHAGGRLVLLNSTWNPASLFGDGGADDVLPLLLPRLTSELPADEYRVAAVLHPNVWAGHGPGQIRLWLDRARRAGLTLVDPLESWRQALIAADAVIGDFGSVSYYAAALGTPVLVRPAPPDALGETSPVADFVRRAPRLDPYAPLLPQVERLLAGHRPLPGPAELTTSAPGRSASLLRELFYRLIGIPEPGAPALLDTLPLPPYEPPVRTAPLLVVTGAEGDGTVTVRRYAEPEYDPGGSGEVHLVVHEDSLDPGALDVADVIWRQGAPDDPRLGPPGQWAAEVLERYPGCTLAAYVTGPSTCVVRGRRGPAVELSSRSGADPSLFASAFLARLHAGRRAGQPPAGGFTVRTGPSVHEVASRLLGADTPAEDVEVVELEGGPLGGQRPGGGVDEP